MYRLAPTDLRVNNQSDAIGVPSQPGPLLSWSPPLTQHSAQVQVYDGDGAVVWDSDPVSTTAPELRLPGEVTVRLRGATTYRWRVRVRDPDGQVSAWSHPVSFETGLLHASDWRGAQWISRPVPAGQRIVRQVRRDRLDWVAAGEVIGQEFTVGGDFTALTLDVQSDREATPQPVMQLIRLTAAGQQVETVAELDITAGMLMLDDRFTANLVLPQPVPPGRYEVALRTHVGRIGWWTADGPMRANEDDGVSPLPVTGAASRDGQVVAGVRALGVETVSAADPLFRRTFRVPVEVVSARLHGVGVGYGDFSLNGRNVHPQEVLNPAPTDFSQRILTNTYDVTSLLRPGDNELQVAAGRGFYATRGVSTWSWNLAEWHREPAVIATLLWTDATGDEHVLVSDHTWESAAGPVVSDVLYVGETTRRISDDELVWEPAQPVAGPAGRLVPRTLPPITRADRLAPLGSSTSPAGHSVHDFGEVTTGWVACTVSGGAGDAVVLRYGEQLDAEGNVLCDNVLASRTAQVDRLELTGPHTSTTWEPQFAYRGFRYVQVELTGKTTVDELIAVSAHTAVQRAGDFACSDVTLTWIDDAFGRTFLNNLHGVPTDTPVYEKNGWTADGHLGMEAALGSFHLREVLQKWIVDHQDAQDDEGMTPQIVPTPGWGRAPDPAWSASTVLLPWYHYWEYGDVSVLQDSIDMVRRYVRRLHAIAEPAGWLWPLHSWGDWLAPGHQFAPEGPTPAATAMLGHLTDRAADIAEVLEGSAEATSLRVARDAIWAAYHQHYFDESTATYRHPNVGYRQALNVLPLAFGGVPTDLVPAVVKGLARDVFDRADGHLDVGSIAVKHLLPVLSAHGHEDLALTVATRQTAPGWEVWRRAGSRTLWESWDPTARSHNHYFLGSVVHWIHEHVGGLRATSAGWGAFDVRLPVDSRLSWGRTGHDTVRGPVRVDWTADDGGWHLDLLVPAGARAHVVHPLDDSTHPVGPGRHRLHLPRV